MVLQYNLSSKIQSTKSSLTKDTNKKESKEKPKQNISLLSGILIGFLCSLTVLYVTQVIPLSKTASNFESTLEAEQESTEAENMELQKKSLRRQRVRVFPLCMR